MRKHIASRVRAFCVFALIAGASATAGAQGGAPIRVFNAGELTLDRYTVVKRLWVDSWRASFWVPTHRDSAAAIAALSDEAARAGANAIVNLHCLNDEGAWFAGAGAYYCYGLAIRLK